MRVYEAARGNLLFNTTKFSDTKTKTESSEIKEENMDCNEVSFIYLIK